MTRDLDAERRHELEAIVIGIHERTAGMFGLQDHRGAARQATWICEDGWAVVYTTTRVVGGAHDGSFVAQLFTPTPRRDELEQTDLRVCQTRREAKNRALTWYREHSPRWAAKYPVAAGSTT